MDQREISARTIFCISSIFSRALEHLNDVPSRWKARCRWVGLLYGKAAMHGPK